MDRADKKARINFLQIHPLAAAESTFYTQL
jgi:hypothetical protein